MVLEILCLLEDRMAHIASEVQRQQELWELKAQMAVRKMALMTQTAVELVWRKQKQQQRSRVMKAEVPFLVVIEAS